MRSEKPQAAPLRVELRETATSTSPTRSSFPSPRNRHYTSEGHEANLDVVRYPALLFLWPATQSRSSQALNGSGPSGPPLASLPSRLSFSSRAPWRYLVPSVWHEHYSMKTIARACCTTSRLWTRVRVLLTKGRAPPTSGGARTSSSQPLDLPPPQQYPSLFAAWPSRVPLHLATSGQTRACLTRSPPLPAHRPPCHSLGDFACSTGCPTAHHRCTREAARSLQRSCLLSTSAERGVEATAFLVLVPRLLVSRQTIFCHHGS